MNDRYDGVNRNVQIIFKKNFISIFSPKSGCFRDILGGCTLNTMNKSYSQKCLLIVSSSMFQIISCIKAIYVYPTILPCSIVIYGTDVQIRPAKPSSSLHTNPNKIITIMRKNGGKPSVGKNLFIFGRTVQYQQVRCFQQCFEYHLVNVVLCFQLNPIPVQINSNEATHPSEYFTPGRHQNKILHGISIALTLSVCVSG